MKNNLSIIAILFLFAIQAYSSEIAKGKTSLTGTITDKKTAEQLVGVTVYFPDLKVGANTDEKGHFSIENLPTAKVLIQLSYIGYRTLIETIDLAEISEQNFEMEYAATELNEVVVTGNSNAIDQKHTPSPIAIVSKTILLQNASTNIIDAIASQPGISQITTGAGISKPVIRGLGYNRVLVVNDGIRQEGQQWGDEHGIEIDEYSIDKVEILKGPASLAFGSDAMAGVINMLSAPSLQEGKLSGNIISNYQSNNGLIGYSGNVAGNKNGILWEFRMSGKQAHAYKNKYDGYVFNSGFKENAYSGLVGLNKSWGYSHLNFGAYYLLPGLIEGERDSLTGKFVKQVFLNDGIVEALTTTDADNYSFSPKVPYQKVYHYKIISNSSFIIGDGNLKTTFGFQQDRRQEFGDAAHVNQYGLYFFQNTLTYDLHYTMPEMAGIEISCGTSGMQQNSQNKGIEYLVPEYNLFDIGFFSIAKRKFGAFDISGGVRFDNRSEKVYSLYLNSLGEKTTRLDINSTQRFADFKTSFGGFSGSIGTAWQISDKAYTKLNFSRGFRAPNIGELASNGLHEGTMRYELGNVQLKPENSIQIDYSFGFNIEHMSAEINLFDNKIDNFVYSRKLLSTAGTDSLTSKVSTFKFVSGKAHLYGGEFRFDLHPHPLDWIHFENTFSYVRAIQENQPDSTRNLPLTPAPRWLSTLKFEFKEENSFFHNAYIQIVNDYNFAQNDFYVAYTTETRTPAYSLINIGIGTDFVYRKSTLCSLYVSINNLTDIAYQSHLSRLKYLETNYNTGRNGVYNMGRNFSFKLVIPLDTNL